MKEQREDNSGFHVQLDGIELSHEAKHRIQAGIQSLVMSELAAYKPNPDDPDGQRHPHFGGGVIVFPPKWWWGFIVRKIRPDEINVDLGPLKKLSDTKQFESGGIR